VIAQSYHPVIKPVPDELLLTLPARQAADLVRRREEAIGRERTDPHNYGYHPPMWRKVDLHVAEMRLANPLAVLEILIMGGIRSAKTEFAAARLAPHVIHFRPYNLRGDYVAWTWSLHENERASETIAQTRIYKYLPPELKTDSGKAKHTRSTKLSYTEGSGFTNEMFITDGRLCDFKMYGADNSTLQGAELTAAWSDELVPKSVVATVKERLNTRAKDTGTAEHRRDVEACRADLLAGRALTPQQVAQLYLAVHIITFTPKEGYSATVADFLDGSRILEEEDAELLPLMTTGADGEMTVAGYQKAPRVRQCKKLTRRVFYFWTRDNPYGNWEGLCKDLAGSHEDNIRIIAYGDVRKAWAAKFPKFSDTVHIIPLDRVPKSGTWYHVVDPCDSRNWFQTWWLVSGHRHYCVRQWPQAGDYIPGHGDLGDWAETSQRGKADGDPGPAQEALGFSLTEYKAEIARVELELGKWFYSLAPDAAPRAIEVHERSMDSRFGAVATPTTGDYTTLIEECEELGLLFEPASGKVSSEGEALINDKLSYDATQPVSSLNCPHLFVVDRCEAIIFFLTNWTGKDGQKGACKDAGDTIRYHLLSKPEDYAGQPTMARKARAN